MKMRKRIAALLAVAMVAALMPMTAFAASTNSVRKVEVVGESAETTDSTLEIKLSHDMGDNDEFYIQLEGAKFKGDADVTGAAVKVANKGDLNDATEMVVKADGSVGAGETITVNLKTKLTADVAKVHIKEGNSVVTGTGDNPIIFARKATADLSIAAADATKIYTEKANLAKITITEGQAKQLNGKTLEFILSNEDYFFTKATLTGKEGLNELSDVKDFSGSGKKYKQSITFNTESLAPGVAEVVFEVNTESRRPETGKLKLDVYEGKKRLATLDVAEIVKYGVVLESEAKEVDAGTKQKVSFTVKETVADSLTRGRTTDFKLPEGIKFERDDDAWKNDAADVEYSEKDDALYITFTDENAIEAKFEGEITIQPDFKGDIVLETEGRAFEDLDVVIATVNPQFEVSIEPMTVKVGLKEQVGGKIVIKETKAGNFRRGEALTANIDLDSKFAKFEIVGEPTVKVVEGDLKLGKINPTGGAINVGIKRESDKPSTIEITDIKVKLDRAVPEGAYDLTVGGKAITDVGGSILAEEFIYVGERYTRPVTVFTIGSNVYTVNGERRTMTAEAYTKDGRTMVPLRYLAYALGISEESIQYSQGVVTIFNDGTIIQVRDGDRHLTVNGMQIPMTGTVEIKDGRTYAPVREIGNVFGVTGHWDPVEGTATFK